MVYAVPIITHVHVNAINITQIITICIVRENITVFHNFLWNFYLLVIVINDHLYIQEQ